MQDRVGNDIGAVEPLRDWADIDWKLVTRRVKNLRQRIYRATQEGRINQVRSLMKLLLRSRANLLLSIRRVTQENQGKRTAGIDGERALTPAQRVKLVAAMQDHACWQAKPAKRIYIPKANGKQRPLGIPTMKNRVAQAIVKNALEPSWEARFEVNSYGFRPGRSCHDAIQHCHTRLHKGGDTWLLDADIRGAFDNIHHEYILQRIGTVPGKALVHQWLQAGYVEAEVFHATERGTPQGGIISPLLANIALDGLEKLLQSHTTTKTTITRVKGHPCTKKRRQPIYGLIRYADDFVVTAKTREDIEAVLPILVDWLKERGLELNADKTRIVPITAGFDFLGFHIQQFKGKCIITPQKAKVLAFLQTIGTWLKEHPHLPPAAVIAYLNPRLRGWGNYYKHVSSKRVFNYVDTQIWRKLWKWALNRHPTKGKIWVAKHYFSTQQGRKWTFTATTTNRAGHPRTTTLFRLASIPIERHIKVQGTASPDDPQLASYWHQRRTRIGMHYWPARSKLQAVAARQHWICPVCGQHLFNDEALHTHHQTPVRMGGADTIDNLVHLHQDCHSHVHQQHDHPMEHPA